MSDLRDMLRDLPTTPGIYRFYDAAGQLLYVGKSVNIRTRVRSYFRVGGGHSYRTERIKDQARDIEVTRCGSELEALLLESRVIKQELPPYNVMGRNYRHFPFIKIPNEPFPRVELTYELQDDGGTYFGPFPSEYRARESLEALRPLFKWRSCTPLATRACFEHAIGRCSAPCVGTIDAAGYAEALAGLEGFLSGDGERQLEALEVRMVEASESLMFERAAILRDRIGMLRPLVRRQGALQAAIAELDCLVVLPSVEAGAALWLVVRRGRLVHTEQNVTPRKRRGVASRLARVMAAAPPGLTVKQWELDELNIIANWLHRHRSSEAAIALANRPLDEALDEAFAAMHGRRHVQAVAAERPQERRIGPPATPEYFTPEGGPPTE